MPEFNTQYERDAYARGVEAAKAAASWIIDGNTPREHIEQLARWGDDGDPRLDDHLPNRPNLSGEWADAPTPASLAVEILGTGPDTAEREEQVDAICDAFEQGVDDTFTQECERIVKGALR